MTDSRASAEWSVVESDDPQFEDWPKPLYCARCGVEFPEGLLVLGAFPLDDAKFSLCAECAISFGQALIESGKALEIGRAKIHRLHREGRFEDLRRMRRSERKRANG